MGAAAQQRGSDPGCRLQQERVLLQYQSLRAGDPQGYEQRVKGDCNRLRFRIKNTRPPASNGGTETPKP
ncbi:hypothetical protein [Paraburkholderia sp. GAS334]|uniref:hypothetical protein n=1 Tax=Paraburkholderia sp. GAS334 TaxID=3035131 RepID=UPI003D25557B